MIAQKMIKYVEGSSVTRAMFEEGKKMAAQYGAENVYDFSLEIRVWNRRLRSRMQSVRFWSRNLHVMCMDI